MGLYGRSSCYPSGAPPTAPVPRQQGAGVATGATQLTAGGEADFPLPDRGGVSPDAELLRPRVLFQFSEMDPNIQSRPWRR